MYRQCEDLHGEVETAMTLTQVIILEPGIDMIVNSLSVTVPSQSVMFHHSDYVSYNF